MRMIVAQCAAKLKDGSFRAGQFFDPVIDGALIRRRIFAERDQNVAQQNGNAGKVAEFLQRGAQFVFDLRAMQVHRNFDARDRIVAKKNPMRLPDVQQFDGENIGGMN